MLKHEAKVTKREYNENEYKNINLGVGKWTLCPLQLPFDKPHAAFLLSYMREKNTVHWTPKVNDTRDG